MATSAPPHSQRTLRGWRRTKTSSQWVVLPQGGLWLAEADSKAQIEALLQSDPFFTASLRQHYEILHWSKANDARKVLI